jgi:ATP-dependent DNA helicase RecG
MQEAALCKLLEQLLALPRESEWLEFKHNNSDPHGIGEYISALSNSAVVHQRDSAFVVWGIEDGSAKTVGTTFDPTGVKIGGQALEMWLQQKLRPAPLFTRLQAMLRGAMTPKALHQIVKKPTQHRHSLIMS